MQSIRYFRLAARYWPLTLVMTCALILSYFVIRTYVSPLPRQYQLNFGAAKWIEPNVFAPIAYFRTKLFLSSKPEQAWLQVAAPDAFQATVNGHKIGREDSVKTCVAGIYDIKAVLAPGTNVIAVQINRESFPGSAQLLVRGAVKQPGHDAIPILSDEKWKVTSNTGIVEGAEPWDSPLVQDELWPNARAAVAGSSTHIDWVATNPLLFQLPPSGSWLLAPDAPREAIFSTSFNANRSRQETWIQVASSGELDLLVNGNLITSTPTAPLQAKQLPHLNPATVVPPKTSSEQQPSSDVSTASASSIQPLSFEAYDISRWIRPGSNAIVAAVRSDLQPASFLAEGFTIRRGGAVQRFQTDSSWQLIGLSSAAKSPEKKHAIEAGRNGSAPWGYLREGTAKQPRLTDVDTVAQCCAVILATALGMIVVWLIASWSAALLKEEALSHVLIRDALFHVPIILALCLILLLSYDYRFPSDWSFQPLFCIGTVAALAAVRLLHFLAFPKVQERVTTHWRRLRQVRFAPALPYLVLALIMGLGLVLRYHNLDFMSFDHDEMGVIQKSKGVFVRGYPYNEYPEGFVRPATTYELVGYSLSFFGAILGYSEWSMRLPSCIWGTLTIGVIGLMGRRVFNWRTGLIAALVYACTTLNIRWSQNAFYPQQCQLMSMMTFWFFYEAIRVRPLRRGYLTAASVSFCMAFLSWEGCGFILPGLFFALIVVRWGEWWWLKEFHLYRCLFFVAALVIAQFCWRTLAGSPYIMIGSGLTNVAGPSLFFQNYGYRPTFYLETLFLSEHHLPFTLMMLAGLPFCWSHRGFRYVVTLLFTLFILYTNFLAALSPRYCYFYQALVPLGGIGAAVMLYDRLVALAWREGRSAVARILAHGSGAALLLLLFLQSNEWVLRTYYLSLGGDTPGLMNRMNTYRYDYRGAAQFVKSHYQRGDVIIPVVPHVFEYYSNMRGNFFLDTLLGKKVSYSTNYREPVFIDKFRGYPVLRSLTELLEATHRGRRTWILYVPFGSFEKLSSPDVIDYLDKNAKIPWESYHAKVFLIQGANRADRVVQAAQP